ncbi:MAG: ATP synthase subunit I [Candidatus Aminicenantales bacterium]
MPESSSVEERILNRIPLEVLGVSALFGAGAAALWSVGTGILILAGGSLSALNFFWIRQALSRALLRKKQAALRTSIWVFGLRLVLILGIFFTIILFFSKRVIAFAAGFSTIVLVILVEAVIALTTARAWKN